MRPMSQAGGGYVDIAEEEYCRAWMRWEFTPKWNVFARLYRWRVISIWLRALTVETERWVEANR